MFGETTGYCCVSSLGHYDHTTISTGLVLTIGGHLVAALTETSFLLLDAIKQTFQTNVLILLGREPHFHLGKFLRHTLCFLDAKGKIHTIFFLIKSFPEKAFH